MRDAPRTDARVIEMKPDQQTDKTEAEQVGQRTSKLVRRLGYVVFMGGGLILFIPMLIGVFRGIQDDRVWDPFTGERVAIDERTPDCEEEARRLIAEGEEGEAGRGWQRSHSAWVDKCREDYPELHDLLGQMRREANGD